MGNKKGKKTGGRVAGTPNKLTKSVKEFFVAAFEDLQEDSDNNLIEWAKNNPSDFYKIAIKLIPTSIEAKIEGSINTPISTWANDNKKPDIQTPLP